MHIQKVTSIQNLEALRSDWDRIFDLDPDATIYSSFPFIYEWWSVYARKTSHSAFVLAVYHQDKLVAIAPLYKEDRKRGPLTWTEIKFMGLGDFHTILMDQTLGLEDTILRTIFEFLEKEPCDRILLSYIVQNSSLSNYLLRSQEYNPAYRFLVENPIFDPKDFKDKQAFESFAPRNFRKYRNRVVKNLGGRLDYTYALDEALYEEMRALHISKTAYLVEEKSRTDRFSLFEDADKDRYLRNLLIGNENTLVFTLRAEDGELIAYLNCYDDGKRIYFWNSSYNPKYADYRASNVALLETLGKVVEDFPDRIYDFGAGGYAWKFRWTSQALMIYELDYWKAGKKSQTIQKLLNLKKIL